MLNYIYRRARAASRGKPAKDKHLNSMDDFDFWKFSLWIYGQEGVAPTCLRLQESHRIDVNLLLFALWLGRCGKRVEAESLTALSAKASHWHTAVVRPLRVIRTHLKSSDYLDPDEVIQTFRTKIKADEIDAEHIEQRLLFEAAVRMFGEDLRVENAAVQGQEMCLDNARTYFEILCVDLGQDDIELIRKLADIASI